ncbi:hypothetical protein ACHWQZ_G013404 [Mnemiopsis leidyi]
MSPLHRSHHTHRPNSADIKDTSDVDQYQPNKLFRLTLKTHLTSIQTETTSRQGPESPEVKGWSWKRCYKLRGSAATFEEPCVNMLSLTQPGTVTPATQGEPSSGGRLSEVL